MIQGFSTLDIALLIISLYVVVMALRVPIKRNAEDIAVDTKA